MISMICDTDAESHVQTQYERPGGKSSRLSALVAWVKLPTHTQSYCGEEMTTAINRLHSFSEGLLLVLLYIKPGSVCF